MSFKSTHPGNRTRKAVLGLVTTMVLFTCGCIQWTDANTGSRHALVLGFGIVNWKSTNSVSSHDLKAVGVVVMDGLSAGIVQQHEVSIDPTAASNVVVQFKSTPFSLVVSNWSPVTIPSPLQTNNK